MNLHRLIMTNSDCYKQSETRPPCGVLWHSTAANNRRISRYVQPDDGLLGYNKHQNHWNQRMYNAAGKVVNKSASGFIGLLGDGKTLATYQTQEWDKNPWTSGSGVNGNANKLGYIQFEICEDDHSSRDWAMRTYQEAVEVSAYLCQMFGWDPLGKNKYGLPIITDHGDMGVAGYASKHTDIFRWWWSKFGLTMTQFRKDIAAEMKLPITPTPQPTEQKVRLKVGTQYYAEPSNKSKVSGKITIETNYTIVQTEGVYGLLKSRAGWVQLRDEPVPAPAPTVPKLVDTWARANTLKQGSKGKHVEVLQALLQAKGYDVQAIDGTFGAVTDKQVRAYQKAQGITVDGIVGYETWPVVLK